VRNVCPNIFLKGPLKTQKPSYTRWQTSGSRMKLETSVASRRVLITELCSLLLKLAQASQLWFLKPVTLISPYEISHIMPYLQPTGFRLGINWMIMIMIME
jgi:hypothetical protein